MDVTHDAILTTRELGGRALICRWLLIYRSNHGIIVISNDRYSSLDKVIFGVSQQKILSPTLLSILRAEVPIAFYIMKIVYAGLKGYTSAGPCSAAKIIYSHIKVPYTVRR